MKSSWNTPARSYAKGIGEAVADRTINRLVEGRRETWEEVANRVAAGNTSLRPEDAPEEFEKLHHHLRQASILMSGRHLQHGDATQHTRNQEVFTNCSTAASSFILFYLLLNGSGVGRSYDDDMMIVDWANKMPVVLPYIRADHPDVLSGEIDKVFTVKVRTEPKEDLIVYRVPDSREGWAKAIEQIERLTWEGKNGNDILLIDFSDVRHRGQPIGGMQGRPASGPGPLMQAIQNIAKLKDNGMPAWKSTMYVDHYLAECVLVGGARRAARMATKTWRDKSAMDFVNVKKGGVLWSSNNSVTVDADFWRHVENGERGVHSHDPYTDDEQAHAVSLFEAICAASYHDGTGEPGLINVDRLVQKNDGVEALFDGDYAESARFKMDYSTKRMTAQLASIFSEKEFTQITNPCGEISLGMLGGYCVIADVVPYHAGTVSKDPWLTKGTMQEWDDDVEDAFRTAVRALIRVNTMDCLYSKEVQRTNRIGVGMTGLHEYAWARFGFGWKDLVDEKKSAPFWKLLSRFSNAVVDEAISYSRKLGVATPHTALTMKPAGTTSKLFGLTEGAHLPSMREYLRWVQFRNGDPLIAQYRERGYPVRELKTYSGTTIVGFPTVPEICRLGMGDKLVTAAEATPEEQYTWLRLLEKFFIDGYEEEIRGGDLCVGTHSFGNQVSYTLKYDPKIVGYEEFRRTLLEGQSSIKCCSVMPQTDTTAYEYQPEQPLAPDDFQMLLTAIMDDKLREEVGLEHVDCGAGGCPIDFGTNEASQAVPA